ncbi:MAG: lipopolysaccharide biosynthesis protein [Eubacteriales bacterium]|nr:lipopolysaccharide biosynthesis protein [Eubacteriales bacterium]MDD3881135.1 lipopolysaccharide biosynthesis protein [Eubacteriales bacterium]MDD4511517.1 lipopolysaccharide biosynthesis protein [Eubacteriales bacterium]
MKRVDKSLKNLRYGVTYQAIDIVLKFAMRKAMVDMLGDALVGLNGLFTEVLAMLSLAELGVGSAITYSLYKPLSEGNKEKVASLMLLFKRAYQIIALSIFGIGLFLLPFIHLLVTKVDFDLGYIRLVYFLFLCSTASSYLFSYKSALLAADQSAYKSTRILIFADIATVAIKTAILLLWKNFLLFLAADIVSKLVTNLFISRAANRDYPHLKSDVPMPDKEERKVIFRNIKHLFIGRLSGKITNSTDNTLISVLDSTLSVGFYSNYSMIFSSAKSFLLQLTTAASGSIGNLMLEESPQYCYTVLRRMTMMMFIPGAVISSVFFCELSPFISVWLGAERVIGDAVVSVLVLNFLLYALREPLWQFMTVSGLFARDKNISIIGTVANLVVSVALGIPFGMLGIFIGTFVTLALQYVLKARLLLKVRLSVPLGGFYLFTLCLLAAAAACAFFCKWLCSLLPLTGILGVIVGCALTAAVTLGVIMAVFAKTDEMKYFRQTAAGAVKKIAGKLHR